MPGPLKRAMWDVMQKIPLDRPFMCKDLREHGIRGADLRKLADNGFLKRVSIDSSALWTWEATESLRRRRKA
jgi:hypothetical protein